LKCSTRRRTFLNAGCGNQTWREAKWRNERGIKEEHTVGETSVEVIGDGIFKLLVDCIAELLFWIGHQTGKRRLVGMGEEVGKGKERS